MKRFYIAKLAILLAFLSGMNSISALAQCNCGYLYSMPITITNNGSTALTNYQVSITVNTSALVAAGNMLATGNDIRFTDNSCNNLNYWIQSGTMNTANTIIWIKVNNIAASGPTFINMYYGNSSAPAASNGDSTFILFDNFPGATLNTSKWNTVSGSGPIVIAGNTLSMSNPSGCGYTEIESNNSYSGSFVAELNVISASGDWPSIALADNSSFTNTAYMNIGGTTLYAGTSSGNPYGNSLTPITTSFSAPAGIWGIYRNSTATYMTYPGGTYTFTGSTTSSATQNIGFGPLNCGIASMAVSWFRARQYYAAGTTQTVGSQLLSGTVPLSPITGPNPICIGTPPPTLSESGFGGYWSSTNTLAATVNSTTGQVTGMAPGTTTIYYIVPNNVCTTPVSATYAIGVQPANITGSRNLCSGASNAVTFSDITPLGVWSSSNPAVASVGSLTGLVTGYLSGIPTISYTSSTGCSAVYTTTVNVSPNSYNVTGGGSFCTGGTVPHIYLSNSDVFVNYQLLVNGSPAGTTLAGAGHSLDFGPQPTTGVYTVNAISGTGGCSVIMNGSPAITQNPLPVAATITPGGAVSYCAGSGGVTIGLNGSTSGVSYQLYLGTGVSGAAFTGTGSPFTFPAAATLPGNYTVVATNPSTGCSSTMTGSETVTVNPLPAIGTVTGSGNYCSGTGGRAIGLTAATAGIKYELFNGSSNVYNTVPGTSGPLSFGNYTQVGTYTVIAKNTTTGCTSNMDGSAVIDTLPLPVVYDVTGGGSYCVGGSGVAIGLGFTSPGIRYQLMNGATPEGSYITGAGLPINFGLQTATGAYSVVATNPITGCVSTMSGTPSVATNPLPNNTYSVINGSTSSYCAGGAGVDVYMSGSDAGITYTLYHGSTITGSVNSLGGGFDFGLQTMGGTYTAVATNPVTGCTSNMSGSATVTVNPLPTSYLVSGGGNYCAGGTGATITLNGSATGISYQPNIGGIATGPAMMGTGSALSFTSETTTGTYSIMATNTATHCVSNMSDSVSIGITPLPTSYAVTGGGAYCTGGSGYHVGLANSNSGVSYQLYYGSSAIGSPLAGTGSSLDYGVHTAAGAYTVLATNSTTGCSSLMGAGTTITILPLPTVYTASGGGNYCVGGSGLPFSLSGSTIGYNYVLSNGGSVSDTMSGTGLSLTYGLQTAAGAYTITAINPATQCTSIMTGDNAIVVNPLPATFAVSGGGAFCANATGANVYLGGSVSGVSYQLMDGSVPVGTAMSGTGSALNFGPQTMSGSYSAVATDNTTHCSSNMTGGATVTVNPVPTPYAVTGGGSYCAGGTGVHVGLSGSNAGINYQLYSGAPVGIPVSISGGAIDFGSLTAAGVYSVVATNPLTGCSNTMTGTTSIVINALPSVYSVTGGGSFCADGAGVPVGITNSDLGIGYELYNDSRSVGIPWSGTGSALSFGLIGVPGNYTVVAKNMSTNCVSNMASSVNVSINPLVSPTVSTATTPGTAVCAGTNVTFSSVTSGGGSVPSYQWSKNGTPIAGAVSPSYSYDPSNSDVITLTYTSSNTCARPGMVTSAPITMLVTPVGTPNVSITASTANEICNGTSVIFNAAPTFGGLHPTYVWKKNGIPVGADSTYYSEVPANGDNIFCTMTTSYGCATLPIVYSNQITMTVDVPQTPSVYVIASPSNNIVSGQIVTFSLSVSNTGSLVSYQWMKNNVAIPGAVADIYTGSGFKNGDVISCEVSNENACGIQSGSNSVTMNVSNNLAVNQISNNGSVFSMAPNPNKGDFTLKGELANNANDEVTVQVTNVVGQVVYSGSVTPQNGKISEHIQLNNSLPNGSYILNLRTGSENAVIHFVIEQ